MVAGSTTTTTGPVTVTFTTPTANNGSVITSYTATCTSTNGGVTTTVSVSSAAAVPIVVSGLTTAKSYGCQVTARNARGSSPAGVFTPLVVVGAPAAPTAVAATKVAAGQVAGGVHPRSEQRQCHHRLHRDVHLHQRWGHRVNDRDPEPGHGDRAHHHQDLHLHRQSHQHPRHRTLLHTHPRHHPLTPRSPQGDLKDRTGSTRARYVAGPNRPGHRLVTNCSAQAITGQHRPSAEPLGKPMKPVLGGPPDTSRHPLGRSSNLPPAAATTTGSQLAQVLQLSTGVHMMVESKDGHQAARSGSVAHERTDGFHSPGQFLRQRGWHLRGLQGLDEFIVVPELFSGIAGVEPLPDLAAEHP